MLINKETTFNTEIFSRNFIRSFLKTESASGVLLIIFSLFAIFLANSDFANYYYAIKNLYPNIRYVIFSIYFINDGGPFSVCFDDSDMEAT